MLQHAISIQTLSSVAPLQMNTLFQHMHHVVYSQVVEPVPYMQFSLQSYQILPQADADMQSMQNNSTHSVHRADAGVSLLPRMNNTYSSSSFVQNEFIMLMLILQILTCSTRHDGMHHCKHAPFARQIQASRSSLTQDSLKVHARRANVSMHRCEEYGPRRSRIPADLVDVRQSCTVVVSSVNVADMQTHQKYFR